MLRMMLNNIIEKQIRRSAFNLPYSWSVISDVDKQLVRESSSSSNQVNSEDKVKSEKRIEDNPFYGRYANKIKQTIDREGANISQAIEKNLQNIEELNKIPEPYRIKTKQDNQQKKVTDNKIGGFPGNKCLKELVNIDLLVDLDAESIEKVWCDYHRCKANCIYAVVPSDKYKVIYETGREYPAFVYFLPKSNFAEKSEESQAKDHYETFLGQFSNHQIHFTQIGSYHLHKENSPSSLTLWHFPEISDKKGIVLMHGFFDDQHLNAMEAQCLANQVQIYYGGHDMTKNLFLHKFNKDPQSFDYLDAIREFEKSLKMS